MSSLFDPKPPSEASDSPSVASIPRMGAEVGYEVVSEDEITPLRTSGFVCLILGGVSFFATIAWQMLVVPVIAIGFGAFAMRKWSGTRPVGTSAAVIGMVMAFAFGAYGFARPYLKNRTQGQQAVYFAEQFLELVGRGEEAMALELKKGFANRQLESMDLDKVYSNDPVAKEQMERAGETLLEDVLAAGRNATWELDRPARVYVKYGNERVDTYWRDTSGTVIGIVQVLMKWLPDPKAGKGQWQVEMFQKERKRIVAESIL